MFRLKTMLIFGKLQVKNVGVQRQEKITSCANYWILS